MGAACARTRSSARTAREGIHAVVDKNDGALVVPWDGERVTLVGQVKYPVGGFCWEFPQGAIDDDARPTPEETARAELVEETGLRAGTLEHLGRLVLRARDPQPGVRRCGSRPTSSPGEAEPEATEVGLQTRAVTPAEFDAMIARGRDHRRGDARRAGHLLRMHGGATVGLREISPLDGRYAGRSPSCATTSRSGGSCAAACRSRSSGCSSSRRSSTPPPLRRLVRAVLRRGRRRDQGDRGAHEPRRQGRRVLPARPRRPATSASSCTSA